MAAIGIIYEIVEVCVLDYFNVHLVNPVTCDMNEASNATKDEAKFSGMGDFDINLTFGDVHLEHDSSEGKEFHDNDYAFDDDDDGLIYETYAHVENMEMRCSHSWMCKRLLPNCSGYAP
ncbi:hypothetical protein ACH5RR_021324 [Cinchona calisaya]|uniref:Uncharacterized protein n=1 Tax=Cinchona calisaya TaxID=153742 RepID=A0ABD2ZGZ5_9GENT